MKIEKIERLFEDCESLTPEARSNVEYLLVKAILIDIPICFTEKIKSLVNDSDQKIRSSVSSYIDRFDSRSFNYQDIKHLTRKIGNSCCKKFDEEIKKLNQDGKYLTNICHNYTELIVKHRNRAAHYQILNVDSLSDIKKLYEQAHPVLDCLEKALGKCGESHC